VPGVVLPTEVQMQQHATLFAQGPHTRPSAITRHPSTCKAGICWNSKQYLCSRQSTSAHLFKRLSTPPGVGDVSPGSPCAASRPAPSWDACPGPGPGLLLLLRLLLALLLLLPLMPCSLAPAAGRRPMEGLPDHPAGTGRGSQAAHWVQPAPTAEAGCVHCTGTRRSREHTNGGFGGRTRVCSQREWHCRPG
jgi:hypothetical protein